MSREVTIGNTTFIVNTLSRNGATETIEQLLKRVIVQNAEKELRNISKTGEDERACYRNLP